MFGGDCGECAGEFEAVARLVARKMKAADDLFARRGEVGFGRDAPLAIEYFERDTAGLEDGNFLGGPVELLLRPEQLQSQTEGR